VQHLGHDVALEVVVDGVGERLGPGQLLGVGPHQALQALGLGGDRRLGRAERGQEALVAREQEPAQPRLEVDDAALEPVGGGEDLLGVARGRRRVAQLADCDEQDREDRAHDDG
jgi:hypothetical protein